VVEIDGFTVHRTSPEAIQLLVQKGSQERLYEVEWRPEEIDPEAEAPVLSRETPGYWLILDDGRGVGSHLAGQLEERGETVFRVLPEGEAPDPAPKKDTKEDSKSEPWSAEPSDPGAFRRLFERAGELSRRPCHGVLHLWGTRSEGKDASEEGFARARLRGEAAALHVMQALATLESPGEPRLWLVTRGSQAVADGPAVSGSGLAQAPLWGLGRTIAQEHPEIWGGLFDLDPDGDDPEAEARALLEEVWQGHGEDHLALRQGRRHAARLVPSPRQPPLTPLAVDPERTHLVTGGLGGLGLAVARYLADHGARHLVLVGRRVDPERAREAAATLEKAGAQVRVKAADVSRRKGVEDLLAEIGKSLPPLGGIVHAAGVLADGALLQLAWEQFPTVYAPKVTGAWLLHELTREEPLQYFLLFSSLAALIGGAGQGNYAAANAFLDGLAHYRRGEGLPATSIGWGPWGEIGMAAALGGRFEEQRAAHGIASLAPREALGLLGRLAHGESPAQVGAVAVDWGRLLESTPRQVERSSLFKDLAQATGALAGDLGPGPAVQAIFAAPPPERLEAMEAYLCREVGRVLDLEPEAVDRGEALNLMGFDSLMVLELRETVETELRASIPVVHLFRGDGIHDLARHLLGELAKMHPDLAGGEGQATTAPPEALLENLDQLSDEEVDALLRSMASE
jgi:NAD(P)-dependent dehydrogenase (short-subunit alcohol dehydrogenase family)